MIQNICNIKEVLGLCDCREQIQSNSSIKYEGPETHQDANASVRSRVLQGSQMTLIHMSIYSRLQQWCSNSQSIDRKTY